MATVNRASLRSEFDALKGRFEALDAEGGMSAEARALFDALLMLFQLLMAVFMEKSTPKGSRNSGLPSSKAEPDETARGRSGAKGKGPKSRAAGDGPNRLVVERRTAPATECRACGRGLEGVAPEGHERRVLVDIVFETRETTVEAEVKTCPRCRTENRGAFPDDMPGPLRYGHGIVAFATHLMAAQMVPLKRAAQTLKGDHRANRRRGHPAGLDPAPCTRPWPAGRRPPSSAWLAMPALHADETGMRIDRKNHWLHTVGAGGLTVKSVRRGRGREAIDDIGIIPRYGGVLVHDRWASYFTYEGCRHALCGAHLLRDLAFVEDAHGHAWAQRMAKLLRETCRKVSELDAKALDEAAFKAARKRYRTILTQAKRELPPTPARIDGKRGRVARSDAQNLHEALAKHEDEALRFAREPDVPFTNNRAERDIRMAKVKQKVSGCFRTLPPRRGPLPNLKLPPVHGPSGLQPPGRHPNRPQRQRRRHDRVPGNANTAQSGAGGRVVTVSFPVSFMARLIRMAGFW